MRLNIVTVINSISETSMPFNEFVLFRDSLNYNNKQSIILLDDTIADDIPIPETIKIYRVGNSIVRMRKAIKNIESDSNKLGEKTIYHIHQPKAAGLFYFSTLFSTKRNTVFTIHSLFSAYNYRNKLLSMIGAFFSDTVTCVSESSLKEYPHYIKKIKGNKMLTIRNGVDTSRIDRVLSQAPSFSKDSKIKTLVYVARIIPIKNHEFLIDVVSKLKDCKLLIIGTEDKSGNLRRKIRDMGLEDRVLLLGLLPRNEVYEKLLEADIYVSSSMVEGLPISVLEAMYVGLPVVISDISPHQEVLRYNTNVKPVPLEEGKWLHKLNDYFNMSSIELTSLGFENKKYIREYFSLVSMIKEYDSIYCEF